jgi:hypothetical protein
MATIEQISTRPAPISEARGAAWGAIFAGAAITVAVYLVLLILGVGLGFSVLSLWSFQSHASETVGIATVFWLILTQMVSAGAGGYIAGRLASTEWNALHQQTDGINSGTDFYFTVHGLVVWAMASIVIAFLLETTASTILSSRASVIASVARGVGVGTEVGTAYLGGSTFLLPDSGGNQKGTDGFPEGDSIVTDYALEFLFRPSTNAIISGNQERDGSSTADSSSGQAKGRAKQQDTHAVNRERKEIARIFAAALQRNKLSPTDREQVAQLVAENAGVSQAEALKRVDETLEQISSVVDTVEIQAQRELDNARQTAAIAALWTVAALLSGALVAGGAAYRGGSWSRRVDLRRR